MKVSWPIEKTPIKPKHYASTFISLALISLSLSLSASLIPRLLISMTKDEVLGMLANLGHVGDAHVLTGSLPGVSFDVLC